MIVRVGLLDRSENYISRLANYQSAHANETVQFEIYLFTEEQMLRRQMVRGGRMDVLVAEEELLQTPEEYTRSVELAFWSEDKHEQLRNGCPVICRYQKAGDIFLAIQGLASKRGKGSSSYALQDNGRTCLFLGGTGGAGSSTAAMGCAAALAASLRPKPGTLSRSWYCCKPVCPRKSFSFAREAASFAAAVSALTLYTLPASSQPSVETTGI